MYEELSFMDEIPPDNKFEDVSPKEQEKNLNELELNGFGFFGLHEAQRNFLKAINILNSKGYFVAYNRLPSNESQICLLTFKDEHLPDTVPRDFTLERYIPDVNQISRIYRHYGTDSYHDIVTDSSYQVLDWVDMLPDLSMIKAEQNFNEAIAILKEKGYSVVDSFFSTPYTGETQIIFASDNYPQPCFPYMVEHEIQASNLIEFTDLYGYQQKHHMFSKEVITSAILQAAMALPRATEQKSE